ncbi:MAG: IclR family transcriptional regulator [Spirochaetales bacterium]|nr:IclR family transcriptional regulator [Spirochaetales bacterium]
MNRTEGATKRNQSIAKALQIIETMADAPGPLRLQEIGDTLNLPASTVLRFLKTLTDNGYAGQNPDTLQYFLTLKFCRIGDRVKSQVKIRDLVRPHIVRLSQELGESTSLAVEQDQLVVYIDVVDGPDHILQSLQRIGKIAPMSATGVGKVLLIDKSNADIDSLIKSRGLPRLTDKTIVSKSKLLRELQSIRERGFAVDDEECEAGVRCVAAPLRDHTTRVVAAISTSMPTGRLPKKRVGDVGNVLLKLAGEISLELGYVLA